MHVSHADMHASLMELMPAWLTTLLRNRIFLHQVFFNCSKDGLPKLTHPCTACAQVTGSITYNGKGFDQFNAAHTAAYVDQNDLHQPELTVRETFDFAARCQGVGHKAGELPHCLTVCLHLTCSLSSSACLSVCQSIGPSLRLSVCPSVTN